MPRNWAPHRSELQANRWCPRRPSAQSRWLAAREAHRCLRPPSVREILTLPNRRALGEEVQCLRGWFLARGRPLERLLYPHGLIQHGLAR
jgi:hypothetical protein